jgi:DNA polymerase III epsilon subunit-like protein
MRDSLGPDTVFAAFDFETTGFSRRKDAHLTQVAVVRFDRTWDGRKRPISTASTYVQPGVHIPQAGDWDPAHPGEKLTEKNAPGAISKTTDEDVLHAPNEEEAIAEFRAMVGNRPLVGHNIDYFDMRFLVDIDPSFEGHLTFDTKWIARAVHPGLDSYELGDLVATYRIKFSQADPHQASSDTSACALLFNKLIKEAENLPSDRLAELRDKYRDPNERPGMHAFFHSIVQGNGVPVPARTEVEPTPPPKKSGSRRVATGGAAAGPAKRVAEPGVPPAKTAPEPGELAA